MSIKTYTARTRSQMQAWLRKHTTESLEFRAGMLNISYAYGVWQANIDVDGILTHVKVTFGDTEVDAWDLAVGEDDKPISPYTCECGSPTESPAGVCGLCDPKGFAIAVGAAPAPVAPFVADPANPTDQELSDAIERGLASGQLITWEQFKAELDADDAMPAPIPHTNDVYTPADALELATLAQRGRGRAIMRIPVNMATQELDACPVCQSLVYVSEGAWLDVWLSGPYYADTDTRHKHQPTEAS